MRKGLYSYARYLKLSPRRCGDSDNYGSCLHLSVCPVRANLELCIRFGGLNGDCSYDNLARLAKGRRYSFHCVSRFSCWNSGSRGMANQQTGLRLYLKQKNRRNPKISVDIYKLFPLIWWR